jgi:ribosomal protein S18 acetylase RimI-like enzyme
VIIREATEADAVAIARLHADSWRATYRGVLSDDYLDNRVHDERLKVWQERFSKTFSKPMFVLLADINTRLGGFVCVFPEENARFGSFVDNLHVAQQYHRRGIGRRLMSEAAARLLRDGSSSGVYLWVVEQNQNAQRFYEKAGGIVSGPEEISTPDGHPAVAFRFHWPDPKLLIVPSPAQANFE